MSEVALDRIQAGDQLNQFAIRLFLVPVCGFIMTLLAAGLLALISNFRLDGIEWLEHSNLFMTFLLPLSLGLFTGFKVNRHTSALADYFPWLVPVVLFIFTYFSPDPWNPSGERGLFGRNCETPRRQLRPDTHFRVCSAFISAKLFLCAIPKPPGHQRKCGRNGPVGPQEKG
jgi:hypothetical protein